MNVTGWLSLTLSTCRRYAREPRIVRSVTWPIFLTPITLAITLLVLTAASSPDRTVAVAPDAPPGLVDALSDAGFAPRPIPDPMRAVDDGTTLLATDGTTVWTSTNGDTTLELEQAVRGYRGSGWVMTWKRTRPDAAVSRHLGGTILRPLAMIFVLYALVFSLGAISRDRDAEILDVEQSLPMPAWGPVLARWCAAVAVLAPAHALAVLQLQLVMPANAPLQFLMRGTGAIAAAAAVGVAVAGGAGRRQGFSGPFAVGSIFVAGSFAVGPAIPFAGTWLPIFTLFTDAPGTSSLLLGLLVGPAAAWLYAWRERRVA